MKRTLTVLLLVLAARHVEDPGAGFALAPRAGLNIRRAYSVAGLAARVCAGLLPACGSLDDDADGRREVGRTLVQVDRHGAVEVRDVAELDLLADGDGVSGGFVGLVAEPLAVLHALVADAGARGEASPAPQQCLHRRMSPPHRPGRGRRPRWSLWYARFQPRAASMWTGPTICTSRCG